MEDDAMKRIRARMKFWTMTAAMLLAAGLTSGAVAQTNVNISTVSSSGTGYTWSSPVLTVNNGANLTITGTVSNGRRIVVNGTASIMLNGVSITNVGDGNSPLLLNSGANLTLTLAAGTNNTLTPGSTGDNGRAGLQVPEGATLTI
jgi:hypothetical protein